MCGLAYVFQTAPGLYRPQTFVSGSALNFTRNYPLYVRSMTTQYLWSLVRCGCAIIIVLRRIRQQFVVHCACGREYSTSWGCGLAGLAIKRVFLLSSCYFQRPQLCKASGPAPRRLEFESQVDNKNFFTRSCRWSRGILVEKKGLLHGSNFAMTVKTFLT